MFNILNPRKRRAPKGGLVLIDTKQIVTVMHNKPVKGRGIVPTPFAIDVYTHVNAGKVYPYASKRQITRARNRRLDQIMDTMTEAA